MSTIFQRSHVFPDTGSVSQSFATCTLERLGLMVTPEPISSVTGASNDHVREAKVRHSQ